MRKNLKIILLVLVFLCLPNITVAEKSLDDIQEIGKQILKECNKVVITVRAVVSQKYIKEVNKSENKMETQGIVLDSSGLTVILYSTIDPSSLFEKSIRLLGDPTIKNNIEDLKLVLEEGKEIPAKIVLVNNDIDIAFIRPEKEEGKFNFIEVDKIEMPQVLDKVFVIYKLTRNLDEQVAIFIREVGAMVSQFYILDVVPAGSFVFNHQKKLIGIVAINIGSFPNSEEWGDAYLGKISRFKATRYMTESFLLPIESIRNILKQVKESKEK